MPLLLLLLLLLQRLSPGQSLLVPLYQQLRQLVRCAQLAAHATSRCWMNGVL
jgi:hypothetical protein